MRYVIYTPEFCMDAWQKDCMCDGKDTRIKNNLKWIKYWDLLAIKDDNKIGSSNETAARIVSYLKSENVISKASSVLDVGAGRGDYALELANQCKSVTCVDMSIEMLELIKKRSNLASVNNINTVCDMWESFDDENKYDIVFSSMCPAICDDEALTKMESFSRKNCAIVTVGKGSQSRIRKSLRPLLSDKPLIGLSPDVIHIFNLLYANGKLPCLKFYPITSLPQMTLDEAMDTYCVYYSIFGFDSEESKNIIYRYLKQISVDGICTDEVQTNLAVLYWKA